MNRIFSICNISFFLVFTLFISCESVIEIENRGVASDDSLMFKRLNSKLTINIGGQLNPMPSSSQFYEDKGSRFYIMLSNNVLYFFNIETGNYVKEIKLNNCGNLNNYSGFKYLEDSIFVYNYKDRRVFLLDTLSNIKKHWGIENRDNTKYPVAPSALTECPILYSGNTLLLTGSTLGQPDDATQDNDPISCLIDLNSEDKKFGAFFPEQYRECNFGGNYFDQIYHALNNKGEFLYSFAADHNIYKYSHDLSNMSSIYMGSRYAKNISSSDISEMKLFLNNKKGIEYYISQHSYSNILYDKYRDLYYRLALHPLRDWEQGMFLKPFSIIVMDGEFNLISETPIVKEFNMINIYNVHVIQEGLCFQRIGKDEDIIEFVVYGFKNNKDEIQ